MATFLKTVKNTVKYWYIPAIVGVLLIVLGVYLYTVPLETYLTLVLFFSSSFLVAGIFELYFAIQNREELDGWGWYLVGAILDIIIAIALFAQPALAAVALPYFVGFSLFFRSIQGLGFAFELRNYHVLKWGNLAIFSIIGMVCSLLLIMNPIFTGISLVVITSVSFIFAGVQGIVLAFELKKLKNIPARLDEEFKEKLEKIKQEYHSKIKNTKKDS